MSVNYFLIFWIMIMALLIFNHDTNHQVQLVRARCIYLGPDGLGRPQCSCDFFFTKVE